MDFDVEVRLEDVLVDLEGADTLWDGCEDVDVDASTGVGVSVFTSSTTGALAMFAEETSLDVVLASEP